MIYGETQNPNSLESRIDIMNFLIRKFDYKSYLEIGLRHPHECHDHIDVATKHSVDPGYETENNTAKYKMTSDEFFRLLEDDQLDVGKEAKWDLIFIDGLHKSHQVEKDVHNSLRHLSEGGTIVLHDCNPPTEHHARCAYYDFDTPAGGYWNGTVWKAVYRIRCTQQNLDVCVVNRDWGCAVIRRGLQELCDFDNPFYDFDIFAENRVRHLNLIEPSDLNEWLDRPFYRSRHRW